MHLCGKAFSSIVLENYRRILSWKDKRNGTQNTLHACARSGIWNAFKVCPLFERRRQRQRRRNSPSEHKWLLIHAWRNNEEWWFMNGFIWTRLYFLIESITCALRMYVVWEWMSGRAHFSRYSFWPFWLSTHLEQCTFQPYPYFAVFYSQMCVLFFSLVSSFDSISSHRSSHMKDH